METEIKRIDLLVHPFYELRNETYYSFKDVPTVFQIWREHIDEVAKDQNRILLVIPADCPKALNRALLKYAREKLGKRFGLFKFLNNEPVFYNKGGKRFNSFKEFARANGFIVDPKKVKTRGLGEYTTACVSRNLTTLNKCIGLENIVPYRNQQSTVLPRKSIAGLAEYPLPWELKKLRKNLDGRAKIKRTMQIYIQERRKNAIILGMRKKI